MHEPWQIWNMRFARLCAACLGMNMDAAISGGKGVGGANVADKILCPWCGAEMHHCGIKRTYDWEGHEMCGKCGATSPKRWAISQDAVRTQSEAAALRRYTPPLKPMTLEEVIAFDGEIWMEDKSDFDVWACRCFFNRTEKKMTVHYITMNTEVLEFSTYGKTWRCWERKPTDEERSAARWL